MSSTIYNLNSEILSQIEYDRKTHWINPYATSDKSVVRRNMERDVQTLIRPAFVRDIEKILHLPAYNRYADKTQVFSLYSNDDISRRLLHVQLVSRIAKNIGSVLGLNCDLIEAIALGHDLGHTPFGHAGEKFLDELFNEKTGKHFNHNVQSVRLLDHIYKRNISLQTLDGILCHDGENENNIYTPSGLSSFDEFDNKVSICRFNGLLATVSLSPATLEGCVVKVSDMIAYLGKDRQDAMKAGIISDTNVFDDTYLGKNNFEIINNLTVNIIENSYGKNFIAFSDECFAALKKVKAENYKYIYKDERVQNTLKNEIKPMFSKVYDRLLTYAKACDKESVLYKHYISDIIENTKYYGCEELFYDDPNDIVVDFISSMTDDYFVSLYNFLFSDEKITLKYKSYFDKF